MRRIDIARRAGISLRQAKARTVLTSLAISVGAFTITLAMAAGAGGRAYVQNIVDNNGDMNAVQIFRRAASEDKKDSGPAKIEVDSSESKKQNIEFEKHYLKQSDADKIAKIEGISRVNAIAFAAPDFVKIEGSEDSFVAEIQPKVDERKIKLSAGKMEDQNQIKSGEIVVSKDYIDAFGADKPENLIGKKLTFGFTDNDNKKFTKEFVVSAVDSGATDEVVGYSNAFRISNEDNIEIFRQQNSKMEEAYFSGFIITSNGSRDVNDIKNDIMNIDAERYTVMTFEESSAMMYQAVNMVQYGLMAFGALAIVASIFGIINTQYISVLERTQQIGLMKALGSKKKDISKLFRYEAALVGILGGIIGAIFATLVTLFNPQIAEFMGLEAGTKLLQMDFVSVAILILSLMIISVLAGYFPSRKAAKLDPIEALRTE